MNSILASDLKLVNGLTLRRLFDPPPGAQPRGFHLLWLVVQ